MIRKVMVGKGFTIYLQKSTKTLQFTSNYEARNLHLSSILYKTFQFSSRMFNFISKALKKGENTWVRAENFNAIERGELKYLEHKMQQLINDIKNYLQQ